MYLDLRIADDIVGGFLLLASIIPPATQASMYHAMETTAIQSECDCSEPPFQFHFVKDNYLCASRSVTKFVLHLHRVQYSEDSRFDPCPVVFAEL